MKSQLLKLNLPQSINDFSSIDTGNIQISQWSGAVNFLFIQNHILLIKRSETMNSHRGQLAFVGGHKKQGENPVETALREFNEETGLDESVSHILGLSHPVRTSHARVIFPVVSYVEMDKELFLKKLVSNGEWIEALLYPIEELLKPQKWVKGSSSQYPIFFHPIMQGTYLSSKGRSSENHLLWGATARMIWKFFKNYL